MQKISFILRELFSQIFKKGVYIFIIMVLVSQIPIWAAGDDAMKAPESQQITITGTVTDNDEPMPGVNVIIKGSRVGVTTNIDGKYQINVPDSESVLQFSFVGYITVEVTVGIQRVIDIGMTEDAQQIEEVVVTGYGSQKKATLTGSIATVSNKELVVTKNENVVNMLAGKMPGLRITQRTAQPGAYNTKIDVRGYGADPLFVVDGVPRDKDYFSRMDSEEIESISLLKDASAAIYGLRASNGVMLITTKSGVAQDGKVDISYNGNVSLQQMIYVPDTYTQYEWMTLRNEQQWKNLDWQNYWQGTSRTPVHSPEELEAAKNAPEYNWQKKVFREFTPQTQHNLTVNGGSDKLRYYFSLGYQRQDGCYSSGSLWADRWNFRSNVDARITQRLSTRVSIGTTLGNLHEPNGGLWDVYKAAWVSIPGTPFYANDDPEYLNGYTQYNPEYTNLIGKMDADYVGEFHKKDRRMNGSLTLTYEIPGVKGLSVRAFYDYYLRLEDESRFQQKYETYRYFPDTKSYVVQKIENNDDKKLRNNIRRRFDYGKDTNMQLQMIYNNRFGVHSVGATVVYEEMYSEWENFSAQRYLTLNTQYLFAGDSEGQTGSGGTPGDRSQRSWIGKFNYDYSGKYLIDFVFRYDATSRWPKDKRWGFFPGVSLGYRISEEGFIKNNFDFVSNIKIRASYAILGSEEGMSHSYPEIFSGYDSWDRGGWFFEDGVPTQGVRPTAIPNLYLTWVDVTSKNIGMDFAFLNNKLYGSFDFFQRDRDGLLATSQAIVPNTVGATMPRENLEADQNFGWEIELGHRNTFNDLNYYVSGQMSFTRRKWIRKMEEPASHSYDHWRNRYSGRYHNDDFWWGQESGGMFTSLDEIRSFELPMGQGTLPGDWWREDWNGDGVVNGDDDHPIATKGLPYFNYGASLGASYRLPFGTFDLTALFQGAYKVYTQLSEVFVEALPFGGQGSLNWFMDRWHPVEGSTDWFHPDTQWVSGYYPITGNGGRREGTNQVMNASYCRLKTLEIGYSLPNVALNKTKIEDLRVYLSFYNLLTFTPLRNIDPERPSSEARAGGSDGGANNMYVYPNNKTYTIGLSIKF